MIEQGSAEWFAQRLGKATASRIADVIAKTKSGYSTSRANYAAELVAERLTQTTAERFTNTAMQWGTEKEPDARAAYEFTYNVQVQVAEFVSHPKIPMSGASPDGYVPASGMGDHLTGGGGLIEIKCPITATHIETLLGGSVPSKYLTQMYWQMACTGRAWCDFVSYDPRLPDHLQLFVKRVVRDDARIAELEKEVESFLAEVDHTVSELSKLERIAA